MGFIEETGAARYMRDARIAPIYEGTNGIQAMDLVARKLPQGAWQDLFADMRADIAMLPGDGDLGALKPYLDDGLGALETATVWMVGNQGEAHREAAAGAVPYLRMFGTVVGGWLLAKQAVAASTGLAGYDPAFLKAKIVTAHFFAEQVIPQAVALLGPATRGSELFYALDEEQFAAD
jgi:hypothetical protein